MYELTGRRGRRPLLSLFSKDNIEAEIDFCSRDRRRLVGVTALRAQE